MIIIVRGISNFYFHLMYSKLVFCFTFATKVDYASLDALNSVLLGIEKVSHSNKNKVA